MSSSTMMDRKMESLGIRKMDPSGEDHSPKFKYSAPKCGQVNYIKVSCRNSGVRVDSYGRDVQIFSKRKLPQFIQTIDKSLELLNKPEPQLKHKTVTYSVGQKVLCVMVERDGVLFMYVVETNLEDTMFQVYEKNIPKAHHMKIYSKKRDMVLALEEEEGLIL